MKKKAEQLNKDINPYEIDKLSKIPSWIIVLLLKYWAAAAAVFFTVIGGLDIGLDYSEVDQTNIIIAINLSQEIILMIALALAVLGNYAVKQIVIMMYNRRNNTFRYNLINSTGLLAFLLYLIYSIVISFILYFVTIFMSYKGWVLDLFGVAEGRGIEPFTYAFCFIVVDFIFLLCKNLIVHIYERIKYKRQIARD